MTIRRWKPVFLGLLMIIAGASSLFVGAVYIVANTLVSHFQIELYHDMNVAAAFMGLFWCVSSMIVLLTGLYTIRFSKMTERLLSINEKLKAAWIIALIGLVIGIVGVIIDLRAFSSTLTPLMLDTFVYAWIPVLMLQVRQMSREIKGKKATTLLWVILSIVNTVLALSSPWIVLFLLNSMT